MAKAQDPEDAKEFANQVNSEPDLWSIIYEACDPEVKIKNNIFPQPWEIYNCTTCKFAEPEHPAHKAQSPDKYRVRLKKSCPMLGDQWSEGPRFNDIGCNFHELIIARPRRGYLPDL